MLLIRDLDDPKDRLAKAVLLILCGEPCVVRLAAQAVDAEGGLRRCRSEPERRRAASRYAGNCPVVAMFPIR